MLSTKKHKTAQRPTTSAITAATLLLDHHGASQDEQTEVHGSIKLRPRSAPSSVGSGRPYKINPEAVLPLDHAMAEKVLNFRRRQLELKQRELEMGKREERLRQRLARTKCKEEELEVQERRVVSLSDR